jgi:hypothetical protein
MKDRWKTAPFVTEFIGDGASGFLTTSLRQAKQYHIAMCGNGNGVNWSNLSQADKDNFTLLGKTLGYRFVVSKATYPSPVSNTVPLSIHAEWLNRGVTPAYDNWQVTYQIRNTTNQVLWSGVSSQNLRKFLPCSTAVSVNDTFKLGTAIPGGNYSLALIINDSTGYRKPLALAIKGVSADGSYVLGNISVSPATTALARQQANAISVMSITAGKSKSLSIAVNSPAEYSLDIYRCNGEAVWSAQGYGDRRYVLTRNDLKLGYYLVRLKTETAEVRSMFLQQ